MRLFRRRPQALDEPVPTTHHEEALRLRALRLSDEVDVEDRRARMAAERDQEARRAARVDAEEARRAADEAEAAALAKANEAREQRQLKRRETWSKARPALPILVVNAAALYGQIGYGYDHFTSAGTPPVFKALIAVVVAIGAETIALYVAWHAHDALVRKATHTAARLRRGAYLIAGYVAALNYLHFADGWKPTPTAAIFGLFSLCSPWLWGLHTRKLNQEQLLNEGIADCQGAQFGAERTRAFPLRTWGARRWSIDHFENDPKASWERYNEERTARRLAAARHVPGWTTKLRISKRTRVLVDALAEVELAREKNEQIAADRQRLLEDVHMQMAEMRAAHEELDAQVAQLTAEVAAARQDAAEVDALRTANEDLASRLSDAEAARAHAEQRAQIAERARSRAIADIRTPAPVPPQIEGHRRITTTDFSHEADRPVKLPANLETCLQWANLWVRISGDPDLATGQASLTEEQAKDRFGITWRQARTIRAAARSGELAAKVIELGGQLPVEYSDRPEEQQGVHMFQASGQ